MELRTPGAPPALDRSRAGALWRGLFWSVPLVALLAAAPSGRAAAGEEAETAPKGDPAQEEGCFNALQCNVPWNDRGTAKAWHPDNARALCKGTVDWEGTVACFQEQMGRHRDTGQAIGRCQADHFGVEKPRAGQLNVLNVVNHSAKPRYLYVVGSIVAGKKKGDRSGFGLDIPSESERAFKFHFGSEETGISAYSVILVFEEKPKWELFRVAEFSNALMDVAQKWADEQTDGVSGAIRRLTRGKTEKSRLPADLAGKGVVDVVHEHVAGALTEPLYLSLSEESPVRTAVAVNMYRARNPDSPLKPAPPPSGACAPGSHVNLPTKPGTWVDWYDGGAHDKGCGSLAGERIHHVRCEPAWTGNHDTLSTKCNGPAMRRFNGWEMTRESSGRGAEEVGRDQAWAEVYVRDPSGACSAAWATARLHDKGCTGPDQILHVRCEAPDGGARANCADMPAGPITYTLGGKSLTKPMTRPPARLPDPAWTEVAVACAAPAAAAARYAWNEAKAHDKGCVGGERFYHARCEQNGDGAPGATCPDMAKGVFKGMTMSRAPARLPDRVWTEVALADAKCAAPAAAPAAAAPLAKWVASLAGGRDRDRMHDKGCRGGVQYYHVRCEYADGRWSDKCTDMPMGYGGMTMLLPPRRLPDRAWTEIAVRCN